MVTMPRKKAKQKGSHSMLISTLVLFAVALILFVVAFSRKDASHVRGTKMAWQMLVETLPLIVAAFFVAGLAMALLPKESLTNWVGPESGWRGIWVGTAAGALTPGGPFITLPIVVGLMKAGAGAGTIVAFLTSWSLLAVHRIPMEIGILGWRMAVIRFLAVFFFPPVAGLIATFVARGFRLG